MEEKNKLVLKINAKGQKVLSKNQQLFNSLTKRIEALENEIIRENQKLTNLLQLHGKKIHPLHTNIATARLKLAVTLDQSTWEKKFTKNQTEDIRESILELCNEAFNCIEPDQEQEALYDKWSETSYKEELEQEKSESKEEFVDFISDMFGMDVDIDDIDDGPEGFARFQEKMKDNFERDQQKQEYHNHKKSKKEHAKEEALKAEEELKNKSIRSIYITLAKILHPDTEPDTAKKSEKEELMKKVTVAYEQKDLPTLLKLEMEWVHKTSEHLEKLTEDKLKIYISTLRHQAAELESEKAGLCYHPRYSQISDYAHLSEKYAIKKIATEGQQLKTVLDELNWLCVSFAKPNGKSAIVNFCKELCQAKSDDDYMDIWGGFQPY